MGQGATTTIVERPITLLGVLLCGCVALNNTPPLAAAGGHSGDGGGEGGSGGGSPAGGSGGRGGVGGAGTGGSGLGGSGTGGIRIEGSGGAVSAACRATPRYDHVWTFGALTEGWVVATNSTPPSLATVLDADGGFVSGTRVELDPAAGSPVNGSVKLTVPFDGPNQQLLFAQFFDAGVNLQGARVTAQIRLDSGLNTDPINVGSAFLILKSTAGYVYVQGPVVTLDPSAGWVGLAISADAPSAILPAGYDPCDIREIDVSIGTAGAGAFRMAVLHLDTISVMRP